MDEDEPRTDVDMVPAQCVVDTEPTVADRLEAVTGVAADMVRVRVLVKLADMAPLAVAGSITLDVDSKE